MIPCCMLNDELNDMHVFWFLECLRISGKLDEEHSSCSSWCMHVSSLPMHLPAERIGYLGNYLRVHQHFLRIFLNVLRALRVWLVETPSFCAWRACEFEMRHGSSPAEDIFSFALCFSPFPSYLSCLLHKSFFNFSSSLKIHI